MNRFNVIHEPVVDGDQSQIGHFITADSGNAESGEQTYLTSPTFTVTTKSAKVYFMTYIYAKEHDAVSSIALDLIDDRYQFQVSCSFGLFLCFFSSNPFVS